MIPIRKPSELPEVLRTKGVEQTRKDILAYDARPDKYIDGSLRFEFDETIYGKKGGVKGILREAQHDKCCYCEKKLSISSPGCVEHFRPKGEHQQSTDQRAAHPGYYWLAYDWENLLFVCERCNTHKGSLFPLADPSKRALNHHADIRAEVPLFINPAIEDPDRHIRFREGAPEPKTHEMRNEV